jgi:hypothetical protein
MTTHLGAERSFSTIPRLPLRNNRVVCAHLRALPETGEYQRKLLDAEVLSAA